MDEHEIPLKSRRAITQLEEYDDENTINRIKRNGKEFLKACAIIIHLLV